MTSIWQAIAGVGLVFLFTGCVADTPGKTYTPEPIYTDIIPSATFAYPTIIPTTTHLPEPTATPMPDVLRGLGEVLFEDDFRIDRGWELSQRECGAISLSNNRLVIAIRQSQSFLFSLAPDILVNDFFLEVEVRAEICQPGDEFGVLFRANENLEHYRFALDCGGESRMVRILSGESRSITPPSTFPFIRTGPMTSNRLSIKAVEDSFQFWINGFEAFSSRDTRLGEGAVGLFVRSGGGNQVTVSFDDFILRELLPTSSFDSTTIP